MLIMVLLVQLVLCMTKIFGNDLNKQLANKKNTKENNGSLVFRV